MANGFARLVGKQVLLRDIGDIFRVFVFGEQVIEGLILARPVFSRDGLPPFLSIGEFRVDVENHPPERVFPVAHDLSQTEFRQLLFHIARLDRVVLRKPAANVNMTARRAWVCWSASTQRFDDSAPEPYCDGGRPDMTVHQQFAALPYVRSAAGVLVLLVTSRETRRWVIPKGWAKSGARRA